MRKALKNVKLILLGVVTTVTPILFIFQAESIDKKIADIAKEKKINDSLIASNLQKEALIAFFEHQTDTSKIRFYCNPTNQVSQTKDYSQILATLNGTLVSIKKEIESHSKPTPDNDPNVDTERQIEYKNIIRGALHDSEKIEMKILELCEIRYEESQSISPELMKKIDEICRLVDDLNYRTKWNMILNGSLP